jgi:hypothetical protein
MVGVVLRVGVVDGVPVRLKLGLGVPLFVIVRDTLGDFVIVRLMDGLADTDFVPVRETLGLGVSDRVMVAVKLADFVPVRVIVADLVPDLVIVGVLESGILIGTVGSWLIPVGSSVYGNSVIYFEGIAGSDGSSVIYFDGTAGSDGISVIYRDGMTGISVKVVAAGGSIDGTTNEGIAYCVGRADTDRFGAKVYVGSPAGTEGKSPSVGSSVRSAGRVISPTS